MLTIYLNDTEPLNFQLENEENLGDVYQQILTWLQQSNIYVMQFLIDKKDSDDVANWQGLSLSEVDELNIRTGNKLDVFMEIAHSALTFCEALQSEPMPILQFSQRLDALLSDLKQVIVHYEETLILALFKPYLNETGDLLIEDDFNKEKIISQVAQIFEARQLQLQDPTLAFNSLKEELRAFLTHLEQIPLLLQNSEREQAEQLLSVLFLKLETLILLFFFVNDEQAQEPLLMKQLTPFLAELEEAYANHDTILISDLISYEILPVLQEFLAE